MRSGLALLLPYGRYAGWLYLAAVLDLFSRRVIGWAMAATQDEALRAFTSRSTVLLIGLSQSGRLRTTDVLTLNV
jgi:transposase InsO family protein